jgi:diacylglycerol O-acyltransferase / wax synthase
MTSSAIRDEFMRASDAFTWYQESDPLLRSTIVGIAWLDRTPDWDRLTGRVEAATRLIPRLRQRVEEPPAHVAAPRWVVDEGFDLAWHLRRVSTPPPHTAASVLALARLEAMTGFDRARPLWIFTLVDDLDDGRAALVMKLHHALTDGQGAVRLAPFLFDQTRVPTTTPAPTPPEAEHTALLPASLAHTGGRLVDLVTHGVRGIIPAGMRLIRDPVGSVRTAVDVVRSIATTVAPVLEIRSPVMRGRGLTRHLEVVAVELADLRQAAKAAHATVNDAFLAGVTGGLRRYHDKDGEPTDELRVTMPVSIRTEADSFASNRITLIRFPLPVAEAEPAIRMRRIGHRCHAAKNAPPLPFTDVIAAGLDLLPAGVVGMMLKRVDFLASDVTGAPTTLFLAGAEVTANTAFGPTMGSAANITLMSYAGTCHVAINLDSAAIPDPRLFTDCLAAGFDEVLALTPPFTAAQVIT